MPRPSREARSRGSSAGSGIRRRPVTRAIEIPASTAKSIEELPCTIER